jgi:hypothetical protein
MGVLPTVISKLKERPGPNKGAVGPHEGGEECPDKNVNCFFSSI